GTINADVKFCKYCAFDLSQPIKSAATAEFKYQEPFPQVAQIAQFEASESSAQPQTAATVDNPASFISPAGAAFAVICFFMPWVGISACGMSKDISGSEIAGQDGSFYLLPLMGIVSVGA